MSNLTTTVLYNSAPLHTFDSDLLEIGGVGMRLKDLTPTDETFFASYASSVDGMRGAGTLTGTAANNAAASGGKLVLTSGSADTVTYAADGNADAQQTITVRMKLTPNWTGDPGANVGIFMIQRGAADTKNQIKLEYLTGSGFRIFVKDSAGIIQLNYIPGTWSPTSGTEYEIQVCLDLTAGANRLFIEGAQIGTTNTDTATRDANIAHFSIGDSDIGALPNFSVDDVQIFSSVQHTSAFTGEIPRAVIQYVYSVDNPSALQVATFGATNILSLVEGAGTVKSGSDELKYTLRYNGSDYYLLAGVPTVSDETYAQSNTAAEITANAWDIDPDEDVQLRTFFHSDDGTSTPEAQSSLITYEFFSVMTSLSECIVWGYIYENLSPVTASVIFKSQSIQDGSGNFVNIDLKAITDSNGYFSITLPETATASVLVDVTIEYLSTRGNKTTREMTVTIPNQSTASLESLV